jgi:uncharacterized protein
VEFEFDPAKSQSNQAKHKIDFVDAQALWSDQAGVEIKLNFKDEQKARIWQKRKQWKNLIADLMRVRTFSTWQK